MIKLRILALTFMPLIFQLGVGQTITWTNEEYEQNKALIESLQERIKTLEIDSINLTEQLNRIRNDYNALQLDNEQERIGFDLTYNDLTSKIDALNSEIDNFRDLVGKSDDLRLSYGYCRFDIKYSQTGIKRALIYFDEITDSKVKAENNGLKDMLNEYGRLNQVVIEMLSKLQNDPDQHSPTGFDKWRDNALKRLNNNEFIQTQNKYHRFGKFEYLNNIVEMAKRRIEHANLRSGIIVDLQDLIDMLQTD